MKGPQPHLQDPALLEKGGYGCVFTPPIPCKKSKAKKKVGRTVGKILVKEDAEVELEASTIIQGIPGWQRYFIVQEQDDCTDKNFHNLRESFQKVCKVPHIHKAANKNLTQLISPYGGKNLLSLAIHADFDFLGNLRHVLEGVALLQEAGVCHYDIKELNILVDFHGTFRLIDFGSAFLGDAITEKNLWRRQYPFLPEYIPLPPEFTVQGGLHDGMSLKESIEGMFMKKKTLKLIESVLGVSMEQNKKRVQHFWAEQEEWKGGSWLAFFHEFWRKYDSWGVGTIFLRLLHMSLLQREFVEKVWKLHSEKIQMVLKGLLAVNPYNRLTCADALLLLPA
uniref:Protein kinase domain-containing protein n=1 Tax=viral metagenome TaxID=1070528 RepID=A0A6C0KMW4_9ZZZZ